MCCLLVFEFSVGIGGFVIGLGQISFFFSFFQIHWWSAFLRSFKADMHMNNYIHVLLQKTAIFFLSNLYLKQGIGSRVE